MLNLKPSAASEKSASHRPEWTRTRKVDVRIWEIQYLLVEDYIEKTGGDTTLSSCIREALDLFISQVIPARAKELGYAHALNGARKSQLQREDSEQAIETVRLEIETVLGSSRSDAARAHCQALVDHLRGDIETTTTGYLREAALARVKPLQALVARSQPRQGRTLHLFKDRYTDPVEAARINGEIE